MDDHETSSTAEEKPVFQAYQPIDRWQSILLFWLFCISIGAIFGTIAAVLVR